MIGRENRHAVAVRERSKGSITISRKRPGSLEQQRDSDALRSKRRPPSPGDLGIKKQTSSTHRSQWAISSFCYWQLLSSDIEHSRE